MKRLINWLIFGNFWSICICEVSFPLCQFCQLLINILKINVAFSIKIPSELCLHDWLFVTKRSFCSNRSHSIVQLGHSSFLCLFCYWFLLPALISFWTKESFPGKITNTCELYANIASVNECLVVRDDSSDVQRKCFAATGQWKTQLAGHINLWSLLPHFNTSINILWIIGCWFQGWLFHGKIRWWYRLELCHGSDTLFWSLELGCFVIEIAVLAEIIRILH